MKNDPLFSVVGDLIRNGKVSKWMEIFEEVQTELVAAAIGTEHKEFELAVESPLYLTIGELCEMADLFRVPRFQLFRMIDAYLITQQN